MCVRGVGFVVGWLEFTGFFPGCTSHVRTVTFWGGVGAGGTAGARGSHEEYRCCWRLRRLLMKKVSSRCFACASAETAWSGVHINHANWTEFQRYWNLNSRRHRGGGLTRGAATQGNREDYDRVGWVGVGTVGSGLRWSTTAATSAIHMTRGAERVGWGARHDGGLGRVARGSADASPPAH